MRMNPTTWLGLLVALHGAQAQDARLDIAADHVVGTVSRQLTGACIEDVNHEIYGGIYSQMIFGESFQEPPPARSIKGFTAHGGRWVVRDGVVSIDGLDGPKLVSQRGAFTDGVVGVELRLADRRGGNAGLIVRVSEPGTGADNFIGYEVALDAGRQMLRLARHRKNFEPIRDVPCEVAVGRWTALQVRLTGSLIEIFVDGKPALSYDDGADALPAGTVGLRPWHCEVSYRNLWWSNGEQFEPLSFRAKRGCAPDQRHVAVGAARLGEGSVCAHFRTAVCWVTVAASQFRFRRGRVGCGKPGTQPVGRESHRG